MARNRQNLNIIYISDRMRETLRPIAFCALTAVVAPMGYGKTTAVRWFLAEQAKAGAVVLQASIYSDNRSIFWKSVQKAFAAAGLTVLEGYDCPADASGAALLLEDLCAALDGKTPYYLFLDDFHLLGDERVAQFLCRLAYRLPENVHLIVASRNRFLPGEQVVRLGRRLHRIEADGLRLNREELLAYTHRCGVEITAAQAESLLRSCEGWFSAVYLNLHALAERGSLLQPGPDIYAMFTAAMLESLPEKTRGFLAVMGLADEFTVEMARAVTALPDAEEVLRALTQQNAFVTRLPDGVSFRFHHMMKECAERLFAQLPAARQTEVWQRYGRWYAQKAQYLHALQAFEHCGDRDAALAVIEADAGDLLASLSPAELLQRLDRCPVEALQRHPLAILVLMRRMFTWQQIPKMMELKALLEAAVAQHPEWPAAERGNLLGECDLIQSFLFYNDITQMSCLHRSASRQMSRPAVTLRNSGSWTFGSPSVLMMYYRAPGELGKELAEMYECMPHYYKITNGHGRGAELLMDAEAAYLQGAWEKAAVLLERARADAAGQENMTLCCDFLALRLALCGKGKEGVRFCRQARRPAAKARRGAGASAGKHRRLFLRFAGQAGAGPGAVPGAQAGRGELLWALPPHDVPHRAAGLAGAGGVREGDRPQRGPAAPVRGHALRSGGPAGPHPAGGGAAALRPAGRGPGRAGSGFAGRCAGRFLGALCGAVSRSGPPAGRGGLGRVRATSGALRGPHPARRPGLCRPAGPARPRAGAAPDRPRPGAGPSGGRAVHQQGDRRRPLPLRRHGEAVHQPAVRKAGYGRRPPHPPRPPGRVVPEKRPPELTKN